MPSFAFVPQFVTVCSCCYVFAIVIPVLLPCLVLSFALFFDPLWTVCFLCSFRVLIKSCYVNHNVDCPSFIMPICKWSLSVCCKTTCSQNENGVHHSSFHIYTPGICRMIGTFMAMWCTVTHTLVWPFSSSSRGSLHWLTAEKNPWILGRGVASDGGGAMGLSSPPWQNHRKVMRAGWKREASTVRVTTPGELEKNDFRRKC